MSNGSDITVLKEEWKVQINLEWKKFVEKKVIHLFFSNNQIYQFFEKLIWEEANYIMLKESEVARVKFRYPGYEEPIELYIENFYNGYSMYLIACGKIMSFKKLLGVKDDKNVFSLLLEFKLFDYVYEFQKLIDSE